MQVKAKKKSKAKGVSQLVRKHSKPGKQIKRSAPGHRKLLDGTNDATGKHLVPFALKPVVNEIPYLHIASLQGEDIKFGSEADQLQVIKDLYPAISPKELKLSSDTNPSTVLHQLLNSCDLFKKFEKWNIEKDKDGYHIKGLNCLDAESACFIPIDFLSQINQTHERLHEFLIYAFRLVRQCNGISLLGEWVQYSANDHNHGMYYDQLLERQEWDSKENEDDYDEETSDGESDDFHYSVKHSLDYYGHKGIVRAYDKLLSGVASLREFKKQLAAFIPSNEFEEEALPFLKATLALAETKKSIYDYCKEPWESGEATPAQYLQVVWTVDDDDNMYQVFSECLDASASGCGVVGFCWDVILKKGNNYSMENDLAYLKKVDDFYQLGREMAHNIKDKLKSVGQYPPKQFKKTKNGRLIDIL